MTEPKVIARPVPMKVLSVWCPWAQLIFHGKDVENRGWMTSYRGPLAIHASKGNHSARECVEILDSLVEDGLIAASVARGIAGRVAEDRGKVIGVVRVVGAKRTSTSPWWVRGEVAIELSRQCLLVTPIVHRGEQGMRDFVLPAGAALIPRAAAPAPAPRESTFRSAPPFSDGSFDDD